jgi:2,5-diketo-D-gluconate reductase A
MTVPSLTLNDQATIPQLGFGVYQVPPDETKQTVLDALEVGYRHIDTAQMYRNEEGVGAALAESGLDRGDVYLTTKLNNNRHEPAAAKASLRESLDKLGVDKVDLFLIHWPLPTQYDGDFVSTWEALAELREEGLTTSIGVSNFHPAHLAKIVDATGVVPAVNQIEVHPYLTNEAARKATLGLGARVEAWSPIAQGAVLDNPALREIGARYGKTAAQATLRWHIDRGDIVFPKTMSQARMRENFDIFDFGLNMIEVGIIDELDQGESGRTGPNPDHFDWIPKG